MAGEFIGKGWASPIRTDATGSIALVSGDRELQEAIRLILGTVPGERPMRPEFGCRIHDFVFASVNATTEGRVAYEVKIALNRWEPRITVEDVVVTHDPEREGTLFIDISYVERETNDPRNLVFPFYVIPAEPELSAGDGATEAPTGVVPAMALQS
jgi:phage baseplate assembly protein W